MKENDELVMSVDMPTPPHGGEHTPTPPNGGEITPTFCNTRAGELIISHAHADAAAIDLMKLIREGRIEHVKYGESMEERLNGWEVKVEETFASFPYQLYRISVPIGQESWKANYLQFQYRQLLIEHLRQPDLPLAFAAALGRSDLHFIVQPNHLLRASAAAPARQPIVSSSSFQFSEYHQQYKRMLNIPALRSDANSPVEVAVLDTGVAQDFVPVVAKQENFIDRQKSADDDNGHGTIMCKIIQDIAPFAKLHVFKVVAADGIAVEWDVLAALCALGSTSIVNISLTFGIRDDITCAECGHKANLSRALTYSHASRSTVFENIVNQAIASGHIIIASAGNAGKPEVDYPARFDGVLAISSVSSTTLRSSFSNYGQTNAAGKLHSNRFALPGGETKQPQELIGAFGADTRNMAGTSHAAAYCTGVVAHLWQRAKPENRTPELLIPQMRADDTFAAYKPADHGKGILRLKSI